jgi:hypothetical protein
MSEVVMAGRGSPARLNGGGGAARLGQARGEGSGAILLIIYEAPINV